MDKIKLSVTAKQMSLHVVEDSPLLFFRNKPFSFLKIKFKTNETWKILFFSKYLHILCVGFVSSVCFVQFYLSAVEAESELKKICAHFSVFAYLVYIFKIWECFQTKGLCFAVTESLILSIYLPCNPSYSSKTHFCAYFCVFA